MIEDFDFPEVEDDAADVEIDDEGIVYQITSFGADFLVDGLVARMERQDIYRPNFQRQFVWSTSQASRFVESILLGLPIPGIFLYREEETQKHLIIDGLQRLTTIQAFSRGKFENSNKVFRLSGVKRRFEGRSIDELDPTDQRRFRDATIHATIIQQTLPEADNSSVYQIFDRLNSGGTPLQPQEIRAAIFHGEFQLLLEELNSDENWRKIFGGANKRAKDQELILRFFALLVDGARYKAPMRKFLNEFMANKRHLPPDEADHYRHIFRKTCSLVVAHIGEKPFRPVRALNVAVFDSVMVALARSTSVEEGLLRSRYDSLLADRDYIEAVSKSTADETNVETRIRLASSYLVP
ncbi:DUF262 domain-containing protein [Devosia sp.]|uniref:DUF262 domain-containing protein n=1 Tax=Devosia sp. TaxID=1871048 RepID=UPI001AC47638|nr:DUF262 domain-containing protein [Devosia sp.]MBN9335239.1 DUF262 domain-containing protein [Devosia sp.]